MSHPLDHRGLSFSEPMGSALCFSRFSQDDQAELLVDLGSGDKKEPLDPLPVSSPFDQGSPFLKPLVHLRGGHDFYLAEGDTREVVGFGLTDWLARHASHPVLLKPLHLLYHFGCLLTLSKDGCPPSSLVKSFRTALLACFEDSKSSLPMKTIDKRAFYALEESFWGNELSAIDSADSALPDPPLPSRLFLRGDTQGWKNYVKLVRSFRLSLPKDIYQAFSSLGSFALYPNSRRLKPPDVRNALRTILRHEPRRWIFGSLDQTNGSTTTPTKKVKRSYFLAGMIRSAKVSLKDERDLVLTTPAFGTLVACCLK